jgi:hypothetical protein
MVTRGSIPEHQRTLDVALTASTIPEVWEAFVPIKSSKRKTVLFSDVWRAGHVVVSRKSRGCGDKPTKRAPAADKVGTIRKDAGDEMRLGSGTSRYCGSDRYNRFSHDPLLILYDCKRVEFWDRLFYVFIGASISAFYTRKAPSGIPLIKSMFPKLSPEQAVRASFLIGLSLGTIASNVLYAPQDPMRAIIAGGSSVALLREIAGVKR